MLDGIDWDSVFVPGDVHLSVLRWKKTFMSACNCIPKLFLPCDSHLPWISKAIVKLTLYS